MVIQSLAQLSEACSIGNVLTYWFLYRGGSGSAASGNLVDGGVGRDVGIPFAGEFLLWLLFIQFRRGVVSPFSEFSIFPCLDWRRYSGSVWGPAAGKRPSGVNLAEPFP